MIDPFEQILHSLGEQLGLPLHTDKNQACAIQIKHGLIVQLERDPGQERLLIASKIIEIPPGRFRENVLKEALKANALPDPRIGIFAYIAKINQLVLYQYYPFDILTAQRMMGLLGPFIQTAESWRNAIAKGSAGPQTESASIQKGFLS